MTDIRDMYNNLIGELIDERCPKCGSPLLGNKAGSKWCSLVGCDYSFDEAEEKS